MVAIINRAVMENVTNTLVNDAIDELQRDLESLRGTPPWGIALLVLISFITCCLSSIVCAAFGAAPLIRAYRAFERRRVASRLLDRVVEMPCDPENPTADDAPMPNGDSKATPH